MAASLARGETILRNCAREPEVQCLCELLIKMGAKIDGVGEETIRITGVDALHGAVHEIIPDRIEAGTYMVAGALTKGDIVLRGVRPDHLVTTIEKLRYSGARVEVTRNPTRSGSSAPPKSVRRTSRRRRSRDSPRTCRPSSWSS